MLSMEERQRETDYWGGVAERRNFERTGFLALPTITPDPAPLFKTSPGETWDEWVARRDALHREEDNRKYTREELGLKPL
jgi:hypothetical protein